MDASPILAPVKVLFLIPTMGLGGSERVMLTLLRHLSRKQFQPHLAVLEAVGAHLAAVPADVVIHVLKAHHARNAIPSLAALCWSTRPRVVFSTSAHLNTAVLIARKLMPKRVKVLVREGADLFSSAVNYSGIRLFACKHMYRRADAVICQSNYMKRDLIRRLGLAPSKTVRIYNPVDIEFITASAAAAPNPYSHPGPNLVSAGRLGRVKGYDVLLEVFARVRRVFNSATLTVIGDGPELAQLIALRRQLQLDACLHFLGSTPNPFTFLKHADLFVLPSRSEAFPNVVLEALALGTPVVASKCSGALWEIAACSERLHIACDTTVDALTHEIISFLTQNTTSPKAGPEPRFAAQFDVATIVSQYEQLILHSLSLKDSQSSRNTEVCAT